MTVELATRGNGAAGDAAVIEQVLATGDLEKLTAAQRVRHYMTVCESLNLNPLTQPFQYIRLNGKLTFYATRGATDQLREQKAVSVVVTDRQRIDDLYVVTARATLPNGRTDESIGAVSVAGLKGEALANALMKAETKAKRRVTLSVCGLSWSDESEVGTIPGARLVTVDTATGEIVAESTPVAEIIPPVQPAQLTRAAFASDHPQGSAEWLWDQWRGLTAVAQGAGVKYADPPDTIDAATLGRWMQKLEQRITEAAPF